jgi:hypothetical protein
LAGCIPVCWRCARRGRALFLLAAGALLAGVGLRSAADTPTGNDPVRADWAKVRGKWELVAKDKQGRTIRRTKEIRGDRETLTAFNDKGEVVYAHTVAVKLGRAGNVRLLTFAKGKVVAGPDKGKAFAEQPISYIYTTDGQTSAEVLGLMVGEEAWLAKGGPQVAIWKRVKE